MNGSGYNTTPDYESCRSLINSYFYQITMGCGTVRCSNRNCFACPDGPRLDPTSAALLAVKLAQSPTHYLCAGAAITVPQSLQWTEFPANADIIPLRRLLVPALESSNVQAQVELASSLRRIFSDPDCLSWSFLFGGKPCRATEEESGVDFEALEEAFRALMKPQHAIALINAAGELTDGRIGDVVAAAFEELFRGAVLPALGRTGATQRFEPLRLFVVVLLWPGLMEPENHGPVFKRLCAAVNQLTPEQRLVLQCWLGRCPPRMFRDVIAAFQQFITIYVNEYRCIDDHVAAATKVLGVLYATNQAARHVAFREFYNDAINELVDFCEDFARWRDTQRCSFSFCAHPYVLDPSTKSRLLQLDANYQMRSQIRGALFRSIFGASECPYLILKVRREHIIRDTLLQISTHGGDDLKKPLKVIFKGEEGIDEGGVQKEFFQLIVRQMFDLNYGMFTHEEESRTFWFSPTALENAREFNLIGKVLGLAIYNGIILDVHFPMVVYRKLMGQTGTLQDLDEANPALARGLRQLLTLEGDVTEILGQRTFVAEYEEFGRVRSQPLIPGGDGIVVSNENREEYVRAYVDWLLQSSVELQFGAFAEGFHEVCGGPALRMFVPEELELLICGSPSLDFHALEEVASTEDGYTKDHATIRAFWEVVHAMSPVDKKRLLFFCTGSDRSPIKGLGSMTFVISRNGPDSDRLPTAHTCFNHLLLPEYSDKEKLRRCLYTAINNAEGFGLM